MLKKLSCKHCVGLFQPVRTGHFYCSDTCRKLAFKAKNRAKTQAKRNKKLSVKLQKLAYSAFGIYLIKELRRAKTVEILKGHTSETLTALVQLRRRCTAIGGYDDGNSQGYYELSHIYPVSGKDRVGLLNLANLAITSKIFNRKHGTKLPIEGYMGSSIPRTSLLKEWKVADSLKALDVLKLARKYLGEEFDNWLKKHLISQTQKDAILKKLKEAGYDIEVLKTLDLKQLKQLATEDEISYFSMDKNPEEEWLVARDELERLRLDNSIYRHLDLYHKAYFSFTDYTTFAEHSDTEVKFKNHLVQQAYLCMHGQPFSEQWKDKALSSLITNKKEIASKNPEDSYNDDIL